VREIDFVFVFFGKRVGQWIRPDTLTTATLPEISNLKMSEYTISYFHSLKFIFAMLLLTDHTLL